MRHRIKSFAAEFDPQPFHLDDAAARHSVFRGLAASGWHTAAATMRLLVTSGLPFAGGLVGLGGEIAWARPTRPGDTLRVESEILDNRAFTLQTQSGGCYGAEHYRQSKGRASAGIDDKNSCVQAQ